MSMAQKKRVDRSSRFVFSRFKFFFLITYRGLGSNFSRQRPISGWARVAYEKVIFGGLGTCIPHRCLWEQVLQFARRIPRIKDAYGEINPIRVFSISNRLDSRGLIIYFNRRLRVVLHRKGDSEKCDSNITGRCARSGCISLFSFIFSN